jgi:hypothetical protein
MLVHLPRLSHPCFLFLATNTNAHHQRSASKHPPKSQARLHAMPPKGKKGQNEKAKAGEEERDEPLQAVVRAPPHAVYFHATLVGERIGLALHKRIVVDGYHFASPV